MHGADGLANAAVQARRAVATLFFVNGAVLASWIPHIPMIKERHHLGDGGLGFVLLAMSLGAIVAMPTAGWLTARIGSRATASAAALAFTLVLPLPVLAPGVTTLVAALIVLGALNGSLDVSMNAQAIVVERTYARPIMSSFHALFSAGGLTGAALTSAALAAHVTPAAHVLATAAIACAAVVAVLGRLVDTPPDPAAERGPMFARPPRALLAFGLLAFLGLLAEGSMGDWSAVYLRHELGTGPAVAALGFAAFSLAMAAGRFTGDALVLRFGAAPVLRASSGLAAAGLALGLVVATPPVAVAGFACVGFGIANIIPVLFSAAGRVGGGMPGAALAAVATTGYFGFLAGPPLIGITAQLTTLPIALALVSVSCVVIAWGAGVVEPQRDATRTPVDATVIAPACSAS